MKKFFLFSFILLVFCSVVSAQDDKNDSNWYSSGWSGKSVKGTGPVVKEDRNISGFTGVSSGISADIVLKQGSNFKVTIEGQKNILDLLKTELKDQTLKIGFEKGYRVNYQEKLKIYVEAPSFEYLGMSGSGDVRAANTLTGSKLNIGVSGSGDFNLDVKYTNLSLGISGSGDISLSGTSDNVDLRISGSGDVKASNLVAQSIKCSVSGSGNINCNAQKALEAYVSGSGDIRYKGSPGSVKTKVSGSGDISSTK